MNIFSLPKKYFVNEWQQKVHRIVDGASVFLLFVFVILDQLIEARKCARPARWFWGLEIYADLVNDLRPLKGKVLLDDHGNTDGQLKPDDFWSLKFEVHSRNIHLKNIK